MPLFLFRCTNPDCADDPLAATSESDFETEDKIGKCPKCGSTHKDHPTGVLVVTPVHYLLNDPNGPIHTRQGRRRIMCSPQVKRLVGTHQASGLHSAVTCPACKADPVFQRHVDDDVDQSFASGGPAGAVGLKKGTPI